MLKLSSLRPVQKMAPMYKISSEQSVSLAHPPPLLLLHHITLHSPLLTAENLPLDKIAHDNRIGTLRLGKGNSSSDREKCSC